MIKVLERRGFSPYLLWELWQNTDPHQSRTEEQERDGWLSFRVAGSRVLLFDLANRCLIRALDLSRAADAHLGDLSNARLELWCD